MTLLRPAYAVELAQTLDSDNGVVHQYLHQVKVELTDCDSLYQIRLSGLLRDARFPGNRMCSQCGVTTNPKCPDAADLAVSRPADLATVIADYPAFPLKAGEPQIIKRSFDQRICDLDNPARNIST
jgi:hypothetical protein